MVPGAPAVDPKEAQVVDRVVDSMVVMVVFEAVKLLLAHSAVRLPEKLDQWSKGQAIFISAQTVRICARTYLNKNKDE